MSKLKNSSIHYQHLLQLKRRSISLKFRQNSVIVEQRHKNKSVKKSEQTTNQLANEKLLSNTNDKLLKKNKEKPTKKSVGAAKTTTKHFIFAFLLKGPCLFICWCSFIFTFQGFLMKFLCSLLTYLSSTTSSGLG